MFDEEYDRSHRMHVRGHAGAFVCAGSVRGVRELGVRVVFCREGEQKKGGRSA